MKKIASIIIFTLAFSFTTGVTRAGIISVTNFSFENPATAGSNTNIPYWTDSLNRVSVVNDLDGTGTFPIAPDGDQWLALDRRPESNTETLNPSYTSAAFAFQKIGTIDETLTYSLNVTVGSRSNAALPSDFIGGFFTGAIDDFGSSGELAVFDSSDPFFTGFTGGTTAQTTAASVSWDAVGSGLTGDDLYVGFYIPLAAQSGSYGAVLFDNVSVTTAIPEPSTMVLLLLSASCFGLIGRRRLQK